MSELSRAEQIFESLKELDAVDVAAKKAPAIKDLDKLLKQIASVDASKQSERAKLSKMFDKINDALLVISVIDKVLKEKDY